MRELYQGLPDLQRKLQQRVDMIIETAKELSELDTPNRLAH